MAIELKKGQKLSLEKSRGGSHGEIVINLNWNQRSGLFSSSAVDLDLGCLYEFKDGRKGCVQALGNAFGSLSNAPYIMLDGDDRTGASKNGETLRVNGSKSSEFKRILVYTFIYQGIANWKQADGIVTVKAPGSEDIIVRMDDYNSRQIMCAIAMIENTGGDDLSVEKIVRFFDGHSFMDRAFGWGMSWTAGRK